MKSQTSSKKPSSHCIEIKGACQNNLKNIDINIPLFSLTVICGPSGSGKSSLALETLYAEGQRRYTETLSNYARQYIKESSKPLVKSVRNIPPPFLLGQKNNIRSSRSTVGTHSEVLDHLRIIFSKIGKIQCPKHNIDLKKYSSHQASVEIIKNFEKGFLMFPIEQTTKNNLKLLLSKLLQDGFFRIGQIRKNNTVDIKPLSEIKTLPSFFYIIVDRLIFNDTKRIADSISQCFSSSLKYNSHFSSGLAVLCDLKNKIYYFSEKPACLLCHYKFPFHISPALFSFNSPLGACSHCKGFGNKLSIDESKVIPNPYLTLEEGAIHIFSTPSTSLERRKMRAFCKEKKMPLHKPWHQLNTKQQESLWKGGSNFRGVEGFFEMMETKRYKMHVRVFLSRYKSPKPCSQCHSHRLREESNLILINNKSISTWSQMTFSELEKELFSLKLSKTESSLIHEVLKALKIKIQFINKIGLGYLQVNRPMKTLSGGEFQRLNLIQQIGGGLSQVLYILDEPTIGLHTKDTHKLIEILKELQSLGNTLVVIEHDPEVINHAENIIEMGPESGARGGKIVFKGSISSFLKCSQSNTNFFLKKNKTQKTLVRRSIDEKKNKYILSLNGCKMHNLKNINVKIPLNRLVVCSGISGSGKTSLIVKTLYPALHSIFQYRKRNFQKIQKKNLLTYLDTFKEIQLQSLTGHEYLQKILLIDQKIVAGHLRSFIATYMDIYTFIRNIMAQASRSQKYNFQPRDFSLNIQGGRCNDCLGLGYNEVEMVFMDPIRLVCETCKGLKFQSQLLNVTYKGLNIHQILNLTIQEAMTYFVSFPSIFSRLSLLKKVGLDYLSIGQRLSTLSGGESQRLKLAKELADSDVKQTLYILDEPSTGLHFKEINLLLDVLHQLIDQGASVLLVEHNLQMIYESDYIIDLGPGAGEQGGSLVGQSSLTNFIKTNKGDSAHCLRQSFKI